MEESTVKWELGPYPYRIYVEARVCFPPDESFDEGEALERIIARMRGFRSPGVIVNKLHGGEGENRKAIPIGAIPKHLDLHKVGKEIDPQGGYNSVIIWAMFVAPN